MSAVFARDLATWLQGRDPMRVGEIASHEDCPVPVPDDCRRADAKHAQKVSAALNVAVRRGWVEKYQFGVIRRGGRSGRGTGPYYYRNIEDEAPA